MLDIEETIANVARGFILVGSSGFDDCTKNMLGQIGELLEIDCAWICLSGRKNEAAHPVYEWHRKGVLRIEKEQTSSVIIPPWKHCLLGCGFAAIDNTMENSDTYPRSMMDAVRSFGIKSLLCVPIKKENAVLGTMVFCKLIGYHQWSNANMNMAKVFSEVFMSAYVRKQEEEELKKINDRIDKVRQETTKKAGVCYTAMRCARFLVETDGEDFFQLAKKKCGEIAGIMQIGQICLYRYIEHYQYNFLIFDWVAESVPPKRVCEKYAKAKY